MTEHLIEDDFPYLGYYDVVVIGAGIVGAMIARELSKFEGCFALVEKEVFSGFGVSKANPCMLHSPLLFPSGPLRIKLAHNAAARYRRLSHELDVVFKEVDEIFVALEPSQLTKLKAAKKWAEDHRFSAGHKIIRPEELWNIEPHVTRNAIGALYGKKCSGGIYAPEWTFALTENAMQNGFHVYLGTSVTGITTEGNSGFLIQTQKGRLKANYVINAAGLYADEIARMVGDSDIRLTLTKGTMAVLDKSSSHLVSNMVYGTYGKDHSQLITPTAHGNILIGLGYFTTPEHKEDTKVIRETLQEAIKMGKELVPALAEKDIIASFAGIRSENTKASQGDFYIAQSEHAPGIIHAIVGSPGLTAAPAIAELMIDRLSDAGMVIEEKKGFKKQRVGWYRFEPGSSSERERMIASNAKYGHIVCRCEQVTEAEILEAIRRGANTMDSVKHLTRAGMGRCQGGFCGISVLKHLSEQLRILPYQVTKKGNGSHQIAGISKNKSKIFRNTHIMEKAFDPKKEK